jgi:hypothetical protein
LGKIDRLVRLLSSHQIVAGSVVLLCLLPNMAAEGTTSYVNEFIATIKHLRVNLGDHLLYGPLPCLIANGCSDEVTIRTTFEISRWATTAFGPSYGLVCDSFRLVDRMLIDKGEGGMQTDHRCRLRLPLADRANPGATIMTSSSGWDIQCEDAPSSCREDGCGDHN